MRIALCLSGQPRNMKIGYKFIKKYILDPNSENEIDIFLHAWFDENEIGKSYSSAQQYPDGYVGIVEKDTDKFLIEKYNPKAYKIEKQIDFKEYSNGFKSHETAKQDAMCSIFYSMYAANNLKKEYENKNNFVYDIVVRARYDLAYFEPIYIVKDFDRDKICVLKNYQIDQDLQNSIHKPMPDIFAFSTSKNMDVFCSVYPNMREINKILDLPFGERYLGEWVRNKNNLSLKTIDVKVVLLHRMPHIGKNT